MTPEMKEAAVLETVASVKKMQSDWDQTRSSPQWLAMQKLEAAIGALRLDPEIAVSETCTDLLDLMSELLEKAWPHHDVQSIVAPMQKHFDGVKSKDATEKLKAKSNQIRDLHHEFLDLQDVSDPTAKLAARLRKQFGIENVRGSLGVVRAWKKNYTNPGKGNYLAVTVTPPCTD